MDESREWYVPSPLPGPAEAEKETLTDPAEGEAHRRLREGCGFYLLLAAAVGMAYAVLFVNAPSPGLSALSEKDLLKTVSPEPILSGK